MVCVLLAIVKSRGSSSFVSISDKNSSGGNSSNSSHKSLVVPALHTQEAFPDHPMIAIVAGARFAPQNGHRIVTEITIGVWRVWWEDELHLKMFTIGP